MNFSTDKIIENAQVKVDEFVERIEEQSKKEPEDYMRFVFIEPDTLLDTFFNKETASTKPSTATEPQEVQIESPEVQTKS